MRASILTPRHRRMLWVGRVLVGGALVFMPAAGGYLTWLLFDRKE